MLDLLIRGCLDEVCTYRYKPHMSVVVHKLLKEFKKLSAMDEKPFQQCLESIYNKVQEALRQVDKKETLMGAINLLEVFLSVLDEQRFEQIFSTICQSLRGVAET